MYLPTSNLVNEKKNNLISKIIFLEALENKAVWRGRMRFEATEHQLGSIYSGGLPLAHDNLI